MSKFLLTSAVALFAVGVGSAAIVPKVPTQQLARHVGEQHLHAALQSVHAAEKAEKAGNTKAALADAQKAIQQLHQATQAFHHQGNTGKGNAGKGNTVGKGNAGKGNVAAKGNAGKVNAVGKGNAGAKGAGQQHPHHTHVQNAIKDLHAAEAMMKGGKVGKAEHDLRKAAVQIQDAIKAHHAHHNTKK